MNIEQLLRLGETMDANERHVMSDLQGKTTDIKEGTLRPTIV